MTTLLAIPFLIAALVGFGIILRRPSLAFLLVLCMFVIEQLLQSYFSFFREHRTAVNYAVFLIAVTAVGLRILRHEPIMTGHRNIASILIFMQFGLYMLAMIYSPVPDLAWANFSDLWPYMFLFLVVAPLLIINIEEVYWLLLWYMIVGSVIAVVLFLNPSAQFYGGRLMIDLGMTGLRKDEYGNPLAVAQMSGTIAMIAALIKTHRNSVWFTILRGSAFILGFGLAISSGSRGQVLATIVAAFMFYPLARRLNSPGAFFARGIAASLLALGVYIVFLLFVGEQNRDRWDIVLMFRDIGLRFDAAWRFIEAWISTPSAWLFGLGTNAWLEVEGTTEIQGNYVHNVAVEILCEQGLVGAAIFATTVLLIVRSGLRLWRQYSDNPALRSVAAIMMAIGAFELFNALKQGAITSAAPFFWWLVIARVATYEQKFACIPRTNEVDTEPIGGVVYEDEGLTGINPRLS